MSNSIGRYEVANSNMKRTVHKRSNASIEDIMKVILHVHHNNDEQTKEFANNFDFTRLNGFRQLWRTIKRDINYVPDRPGLEVIKSPAALYDIGEGDCKSFTIASGTTMLNGGVEQVYYDLVHYGDPSQAHIYPVAIVDGQEIIMDSVHDYFNQRARGEKWRMRYDPVRRIVVSESGVKGFSSDNIFYQILKTGLIGGGIFTLIKSNNILDMAIGGAMIYVGWNKI